MYQRPQIRKITFREHAKKRSMWKGSRVLAPQKVYVQRGDKFVPLTFSCSSALLKCFDEVLVNASDQYFRSLLCPPEQGGPMHSLRVSFLRKDGTITIFNSGPGFPIEKMGSQYSVEVAITQEFSGSNFGDEEDPDRVTGGANGLGLKAVGMDCDSFEIQTVDRQAGLYYRQVCRNCLQIVEPPEVHPLSDPSLSKAQKISHTRIRFRPAYAELSETSPGTPNPQWFSPETAQLLEEIFRFRTLEMAVFTQTINYRYQGEQRLEYRRKPQIYFNGQLLDGNLEKFMKMFGVSRPVCLTFESADSQIRFPWYLVLGAAPQLSPENNYRSFINGVGVSKSNHHQIILSQLQEKMPANWKNFQKNSRHLLRSVLMVIDCKHVPNPQFDSQVKTSLELPENDLREMRKHCQISDKEARKIWKLVKEQLQYLQASQSLRRTNIKVRKYEPADFAGGKKSSRCGLFLQEGDAAALAVRDIIYSKETPLDSRYYGMYNIQGVPMNVRKQIKYLLIGGEKKIRQSLALQRNITFQGLRTALNLDYELTYENPAERATLHYGHVILATDQDLDGIGHICSLILVYFMTFWPALVRSGFVRRLATPLIRAYHGSEVYRFYSTEEYESWADHKFGPDLQAPKGWEIKYYKGLCGHSTEEIVQDIGRNIRKNIYTFDWDSGCAEVMGYIYDHPSKPRKDLLSSTEVILYDPWMQAAQKIPLTEHFLIESRRFQLEVLLRMLKSAQDGLLPSQRKALAAARQIFRRTKEMKVYQLTGRVGDLMCYQHGESSLNMVIIKMAQTFTGSNNIPIFLPVSVGFGDRVGGRDVSGSPRYISVTYNRVMDLLFPPADDLLLDYVFEEGQRCEPRAYVPILPYAILETTTTTGPAWKISVWARDFSAVLANVRRLIAGEKMLSLQMQAWLPPGMSLSWGRTKSGQTMGEICHGSFELDSQELRITQLPLRMWSYPYKCWLLGRDPHTGQDKNKQGEKIAPLEWVHKVADKTNQDRNDLRVELRADHPQWTEQEAIDHFGLCQPFHEHLNMITQEAVREFPNYEEVIAYWFPLRRQLYEQRLQRRAILLELQIRYYRNIQRFNQLDWEKKINIDNLPASEREAILEEHKFDRFDCTLLFRPTFLSTSQLGSHILEGRADFSYIDKITKGMQSQEGRQNLEKQITDLLEERALLAQTTWQELWLRELAKLEEAVKEGVSRQWRKKKARLHFKN